MLKSRDSYNSSRHADIEGMFIPVIFNLVKCTWFSENYNAENTFQSFACSITLTPGSVMIMWTQDYSRGKAEPGLSKPGVPKSTGNISKFMGLM